MKFLKFIKYTFLFFLTFLLGVQTTYAKAEFVLPQNLASFSTEQTQSFKSLEKQFQPNIGFLKEKIKFGKSESISAQNQHKFSEQNLHYLVKGVDDVLLSSVKGKFPNISASWFNDVSEALLKKMDDLPTTSIVKFESDLASTNGNALKNLFNSKPNSVKAWNGAIDFPNVRKDVKFLESFSKALDDATLKGAPINIETRFKDWITNSHLKCRTCATGSEPFLDEVLDNLFEFKSFLSKPGATKVIDDIGKSTRGAEGANWVMKFTKDKGLNPSAFEEIITDGRKFTADIVEGSGSTVKYFECKSWDSSMKGLFTGGNTNFGAQFTNYLHNTNISNLSQFGYHFNPAKWTPNAADLNSALKVSSNLFDTNQWSKYQQLFQFTNAQVSPNDINGLIDFITSNKFNNIVNP